MITIHYDNIWARVTGDEDEVALCRHILSYQKDGYWFTRAYREGRWGGWVRLISNKGWFAAGLVPVLSNALMSRGIQYRLEDLRPDVPQPSLSLRFVGGDLLPHQREAIAAVKEKERGVISHPTAAGKSWTAAGIIAELGHPALLLVHRKDLLMQMHKTLSEHIEGTEIGFIGSGVWEPRAVTVASFQTLYRALLHRRQEAIPLLQRAVVVIIDEAHHLPAKTFSGVMKWTKNARYRIGMSATPYKEGDPDAYYQVVSWTGPTIHEVGFDEGVEAERLVPATIVMIRPTWTSPTELQSLPWPRQYEQGIVWNIGRNNAIIRLAQTFREVANVLIIVERIEHGKYLAKEIGCPFVRGETQLTQRKEYWEKLRRGEINCLIATKIADEGVDIPGIGVLILAGGGKARHLLVQRVGRGMRRTTDKEQVIVFDFFDEGKNLSRHSQNRWELYNSKPAYTAAEMTLEEVLAHAHD